LTSEKLFWGGLLFLGLGSVWAVLAAGYAIGIPSAMGPGFFPLMLAVLLAALGLCAIIQAATRSSADPVRPRPFWPCATVSAAVVAFGLLLNTVGLVPAVVALTVISGAQRLRSRALELFIIAGVLAAGVTLLFIHGLQLPFIAFRFDNQ
jgi:uncharacterized membrane protein YfcA